MPELVGEARPGPARAPVVLPSARYNLPVDAAVITRDLGTVSPPAAPSSRPWQIGVGRQARVSIPQEGRRFRNADGTQVILVAVKSPGALGLRLHFTDFNVGADDEVYVYSPRQRDKMDGPFRGRGVWNDGEFWSGTIEGDIAIVEYHDKGDPGSFVIAGVSHIFRGPETAASDGLVLLCHVDASCSATGPKDAVGRISFIVDGSTYLCTGTLLNNGNNDRTPYFLTAAHCVNSQDIARTVEAYWLYQTASCNSTALRGDGSTTGSGADLLALGSSDFSLLRFLLPAPTIVSFAGWSAAGINAGTNAYGLHHPGPGLPPEVYSHLRRSEGAINATNSPDCGNVGYKVTWNTGTLEGGSSGSGLFQAGSNALIGVLSCATLDGRCPGTFGYYGKLSSFYPSIERYLDPPAVLPLATALDTSQLVWSSGGAAPWQGQGRTSHDGTDAAMSGAVVANQESWVQTTVSGPATLTFWWKISSYYPSDDALRFRLNGMELAAVPVLFGLTDWRRVSIQIPAGTNTLRWTYSKGQSPQSGPNVAWLDEVSFGASIKSDFNNDSLSDLVWQNSATGQRVIWLMNGSTLVSGHYLPGVPLQWDIAGTGDFNGDGNPDIVWENRTTGARTFWYMNGTQLLGSQVFAGVSGSWRIAGAGDFNRDGQVDLLWQNVQNGQCVIWLMNGAARVADHLLPSVALAWQIAATGDFNGDAQTDIVWQNVNTGQRVVWFMNDTVRASSAYFPSAPPQWQIVGAGDFNQDGQTDLLWQKANTVQRAIWFMNGATRMSVAYILPASSPSWEIRNR